MYQPPRYGTSLTVRFSIRRCILLLLALLSLLLMLLLLLLLLLLLRRRRRLRLLLLLPVTHLLPQLLLRRTSRDQVLCSSLSPLRLWPFFFTSFE